jgi:hypothetical protein
LASATPNRPSSEFSAPTRHHEPKIREKDLIRQEKLLNALQCQFYRIDEKNKKVYKVDNNFTNTDLTQKLQNALNEFKK